MITDLPANARAFQEEIFGPILPVVGYQEIEQALVFVRRRPKPLAVYLFTNDRSLQKHVIQDVSCGSVVVNDVVVNQVVPGLPFGGVGNSGMDPFTAFTHSRLSPTRKLSCAAPSGAIPICAIPPSAIRRTSFCSGCFLSLFFGHGHRAPLLFLCGWSAALL